MILTYKECIDSGWRPPIERPLSYVSSVHICRKSFNNDCLACSMRLECASDMNTIFPQSFQLSTRHTHTAYVSFHVQKWHLPIDKRLTTATLWQINIFRYSHFVTDAHDAHVYRLYRIYRKVLDRSIALATHCLFGQCKYWRCLDAAAVATSIATAHCRRTYSFVFRRIAHSESELHFVSAKRMFVWTCTPFQVLSRLFNKI